MREALVCMHGMPAAMLVENTPASYRLSYLEEYQGPPLSRTLPVRREPYRFAGFPAFFDGLLPEGLPLESLLRRHKVDRTDHFAQLLLVGEDLVGAVTVLPAQGEDS